MENKDLIISLIREDLRHNQLILNLNEIGLYPGGYYDLSLLRTIANLLGIPRGSISDTFLAVYESFMQETKEHPLDESPDSFSEMAARCYERLLDCKRIEEQYKGPYPV